MSFKISPQFMLRDEMTEDGGSLPESQPCDQKAGTLSHVDINPTSEEVSWDLEIEFKHMANDSIHNKTPVKTLDTGTQGISKLVSTLRCQESDVL